MSLRRRNLLLGAILAIGGCNGSSALGHGRITELHEIAVAPGATKVNQFVADGRSALIVEGWHEAGPNAAGYRDYLVMLPSTDARIGWQEVGLEAGMTAQLSDPPGGAVRFARGWLDGAPATFLMTATREAPAGAAAGGPSPMVIEIYRLAVDRTGGEATNAFVSVVHARTRESYCNGDAALAAEWGLKLPADYQGGAGRDGCLSIGQRLKSNG